ncbi:MAG: hypothetical protein HY093_03400 [Candidatus Liptonbacteria bacterium]|nr:hypothetical protein [Candidatus Liptonbacteria bacterium]
MAGAIGAYLVRSIFIFDTIGPLLVMFLIFGLGDAKYREGINRTSEIREGKAVVAMVRKKVTSASLEWTTSLALFLAIFPVYFINIQSMRATDHQFWGFTYFVKNKPAMAIDNFHQTLAVWSPYSWNFKRDYAAAAAENHFYNPASISENEVRGAILGMEEVVREHPEDAYNHYALVDLYNEVSDIDLKTFLPLAEKEAAMALKLSPDRQQVYFSLAKTKHLEGKREEAIALVKQGLALNDQVPDAHFYYGLLSFDDGDNKTGYAEVKKAIELGRQWKNYNEPRVVAGFFADAGHLQEAIELYKKALEMNGDDLEARLKLGIGYYFDGQKELAKEQILKVMAGFDLTKSESYQNFEPILRNLGLVK